MEIDIYHKASRRKRGVVLAKIIHKIREFYKDKGGLECATLKVIHWSRGKKRTTSRTLLPDPVILNLIKEELKKEGYSGKELPDNNKLRANNPALHYQISLKGAQVSGSANPSFRQGLMALFGRSHSEDWTEKRMTRVLKECWPYDIVRDAFKHKEFSGLMSFREFYSRWSNMYRVMLYRHRRGKEKKGHSFEQRVNSLYKGHPDLYSFVVGRISRPNIEQLTQDVTAAFWNGFSLSEQVLLQSANNWDQTIRRKMCAATRIYEKIVAARDVRKKIAVAEKAHNGMLASTHPDISKMAQAEEEKRTRFQKDRKDYYEILAGDKNHYHVRISKVLHKKILADNAFYDGLLDEFIGYQNTNPDAFYEVINAADPKTADPKSSLYEKIKALKSGPSVQATFTSTLGWLLGLRRMEFRALKGQAKSIGDVGEELLRFLLTATKEIESQGDFYKDKLFAKAFPGPITGLEKLVQSKSNGDNGNGSNGCNGNNGNSDEGEQPGDSGKQPDDDGKQPEKEMEIDLLIYSQESGNTLAEVKASDDKRALLSSQGKYTGSQIFRQNGDVVNIAHHTAVLHTHEKIVRQVHDELAQEGYDVVGGGRFFGWLKALVGKLEQKPYSAIASGSVPRLHNIKSLLPFYAKFAFAPRLLSRGVHSELLNTANATLKNIIEGFEELQHKDIWLIEKEAEMALESRIENNLAGKVESIKIDYPWIKRLNGGNLNHQFRHNYFRITKTLDETRSYLRNFGPAEYVAQNFADWKDGKLKNSHNTAIYVPLEKAVLLDIETLTKELNEENGDLLEPIFLIGTAYYKNGSLVFEQYLARDLFEEEAMLNACLKNLPKDKTIISYNGASFDLPRIQKRARAYLVNWDREQNRHVDLLHKVTRKTAKAFNWESAGQEHVEKMEFGCTREGDIGGAEMYSAYMDYQNGKSPDWLAGGLKHNLYDLVDLVWLWMRCNKDPKFTIVLQESYRRLKPHQPQPKSEVNTFLAHY